MAHKTKGRYKHKGVEKEQWRENKMEELDAEREGELGTS